MDKDEYAAALAKLAALGDARKNAEARLKDLSEQSVAAVISALQEGIRPADVARSLHYTDGYVRKLRPKDVNPDPRYAHLKPPSRTGTKTAVPSASKDRDAVTEPVTVEPAMVMVPIASSRVDELLAIARDLTEDEQVRVAEALKAKCPQMLGRSEFALATIERAIRANLVTASDLRN